MININEICKTADFSWLTSKYYNIKYFNRSVSKFSFVVKLYSLYSSLYMWDASEQLFQMKKFLDSSAVRSC